MVSELKRLETYRRQLTDAIDEFEHELRRCADAAEREGSASGRIESRMHELRQNIALNSRELEQVRSQIQQLGSIKSS